MIYRRLEGRTWKVSDAPSGAFKPAIPTESLPIQACIHCRYWTKSSNFDLGRCFQRNQDTHRFCGVNCNQFVPIQTTQSNGIQEH